MCELWRRWRGTRDKPVNTTLVVIQASFDESWTFFVRRWNTDANFVRRLAEQETKHRNLLGCRTSDERCVESLRARRNDKSCQRPLTRPRSRSRSPLASRVTRHSRSRSCSRSPHGRIRLRRPGHQREASAYRRDQQYPACRDVHGYAQPPNVDTYRYQSAGEDRRAEMVFGMTRAARKEPVVDVSVVERLCLVEQLMDFVDTTYIWYAMLRRVLRGSARMLRWRQLG
uniref:Uncharacterized protein n=1 Tax=Hyaloperonospora arabidopsidis (strain Emoy2) TaxID=559515 RepID=M4BFB3_HYAAE